MVSDKPLNDTIGSSTDIVPSPAAFILLPILTPPNVKAVAIGNVDGSISFA